MNLFKTTAALCLLIASIATAQTSIKGTVTNKTTSRPAAGDDVVLIKLS